MAYMNTETKRKIAEKVKAVLPEGWKASFAVRDNSTFVVTFRKYPECVKQDCKSIQYGLRVNSYHPGNNWAGETLEVLKNVISAANTENYDNSDVMTDYFDVGYYVDIKFADFTLE